MEMKKKEKWHLRSITEHNVGCDPEHNIWHVFIMNVPERIFTAFIVLKDAILWANTDKISNVAFKNMYDLVKILNHI